MAVWADRTSLKILTKLDEKDKHFADRKWANELNTRRALRGEPMSGMWIKPYAPKRWPDLYEKPTKR